MENSLLNTLEVFKFTPTRYRFYRIICPEITPRVTACCSGQNEIRETFCLTKL